MPPAAHLTSEFLMHQAHELRTPLNSIIGFAELMRDGKVGPVSAEHREYLGDILTSAAHLVELLNEALDVARLEAGRLDLQTAPLDVAGLVNEVMQAKRSQACARGLALDTAIGPGLHGVIADAPRLKQVLSCFLDHALTFTPAGGRVMVTVSPEGAEAFRLEVADTGSSLRPEDQQRLFVEVCPPPAGSSRKQQGAGLGLFLAGRIVELQGGRVGVQSTPGQGNTFFAVLPRNVAKNA
jgi:signal transduction histidine kinase